LKTPGPVLLIPNHVSWLDWLFLWVLLDRDWKCVVSSVAARYSWVHRRIMINRRTFPIEPASPYAVKRMAEYLGKGGRLVLFAEGQITYTGCLMKVYDGTGFLLHKTGAKLVTCYLRGANRLRWSRQPGWRRWWPRISVHFSPVLEVPRWDTMTTTDARGRLTLWLRDQMVRQQFDTEMAFGAADVLESIVAAAGAQPGKVVLQDSTMKELTYRRLLTGAWLLGREFDRVLPPGARRVGVLLPNANVMPTVLCGLWAVGRVPAILNFSTGIPTLLSCLELAGVKTVITSRAFLTRARLDAAAIEAGGVKLLYLEEIGARIGGLARFGALLRTALRPRALLSLRARSRAGQPAGADPGSETAVVLFTSGSEGVPKGVELTQGNLMANIRQMLAVIDLEDRDRVFNALPMFHSFGLTVGTLMGLVRGLYVFLYPSPLHYRVIPAVVYDRNCTVFLATNTFLNGYARKAHPYDFRAIRYLFAGAEKVQEETARIWMQRFGVRVLEGYGATECSPVVSVNLPAAPRHGSAGRLMPGMESRLEAVEGVLEGGRLLVRGPNVMRGYLNAEPNARFLALGGWYDTGDIVSVDEEGFLHIRGRLKRFAKVSGEMVSLTAVEDALAGAFPEHGPRCEVAVVARPDTDKGEVLVAISNVAQLTLDEVRGVLRRKGLPNLCAPRELVFVRSLPKLGSGKVNHRELASLATCGLESAVT